MSTRPVRFAAVPAIPQSGMTDWQFQTLNAMKENIDLLTGARGGGAGAAVTRGSVTIREAPQMTMQSVSALGAGYTISGVTVPSSDDYAKLVSDVQKLANDVAVLRNTVNSLIAQLKG